MPSTQLKRRLRAPTSGDMGYAHENNSDSFGALHYFYRGLRKRRWRWASQLGKPLQQHLPSQLLRTREQPKSLNPRLHQKGRHLCRAQPRDQPQLDHPRQLHAQRKHQSLYRQRGDEEVKRRLFAAWVVAALVGNEAVAKGRSGGKRRSSGGRSSGSGGGGCGSKGGPGYRKPNGKCAGWKD